MSYVNSKQNGNNKSKHDERGRTNSGKKSNKMKGNDMTDVFSKFIGGLNDFRKVSEMITVMKENEVDMISVWTRRIIVVNDTIDVSLDDLVRFDSPHGIGSTGSLDKYIVGYLETLQEKNTGDLFIDHDEIEVQGFEEVKEL